MAKKPSLIAETAQDLIGTTAPIAVTGSLSLAVEVPHQEQDNWCWCAVTVGIASFYDPTFALSQCQTAAQVLSIGDACQQPERSDVDILFSLSASLQSFGRLERTVDAPLALARLQQELAARRPVCAQFLFLDSGLSHFLVIKGLIPDAMQTVLVDDPMYDESTIAYKELAGAYKGSGIWKRSYLTR